MRFRALDCCVRWLLRVGANTEPTEGVSFSQLRLRIGQVVLGIMHEALSSILWQVLALHELWRTVNGRRCFPEDRLPQIRNSG